MTVENDNTSSVWLHRAVLLELDELRYVRVDDLRDLRRAGVDRADWLVIIPLHDHAPDNEVRAHLHAKGSAVNTPIQL
jgi:hypothetical protein